ncbi:hypothetical protein HDV00_009552 [Rhizophlyctis rosea]|nr:hypothetical protein HDV00_009552 [Rhizophlyctis rosea]
MNLSRLPPGEAAPALLYAGFNQDVSCFAIGTDAGFRIFSIDPLKEKTRKEYGYTSSEGVTSAASQSERLDLVGSEGRLPPELNQPGGIALVEMLYKTNFLAFVGGGKNPKFPPNKVVIWDDSKGKVAIEMEFRSEVKAIRWRRDRLIIVLLTKIYVYTFEPTPRRLHVFETIENDRGLAALSQSPTVLSPGGNGTAVFAFLGRNKGQVQIAELMVGPVQASGRASGRRSLDGNASNTVSIPTPSVHIIQAHASTVSCLTISHSGHLLASASEKGTLVRVFEARSSRLVNELRRGVDRANIYSIAFNLEETNLCVASDKGTIHIFTIGSGEGGSTLIAPGTSIPPTIKPNSQIPSISRTSSQSSLSSSGNNPSSSKPNRQSFLSSFAPYLPKYFSSEWSFVQFGLPFERRCIIAFLPPTATGDRATVVALCADGSCYKFLYDAKKGGECVRDSYHRFFRGLGSSVGGVEQREGEWEEEM